MNKYTVPPVGDKKGVIMKLFRFISLFQWLKTHFNDLPRAFQDDLLNDMEEYKELCIISKAQKLLRKEI